jgi:hypothetical protein
VKILLDDDVASAGESGVFVANEDSVGGRAACGIFGAVHKAEEIALVEVAETLNFVGSGDGAFEARQDLRGKFETKIHMLGANVKHQVTGRRDGVARARANLPEGMKFGRTRRAETGGPRHRNRIP